MKRISIIIIPVIFIISFMSCNIFKKNTDKQKNKKITSSIIEIIDSLENNDINFEKLSTSFSGKYEDNKQNLYFKGNLRILKDSVIWISLRAPIGIEAGRIYMNKDSIKFLNRLNKEYMSEAYNFISKKFSIKLKYSHLEHILTNRFFTYPDESSAENYNYISDSSILVGKSTNAKITHSLKVADNNVLENKFIFSDSTEFIINYSEKKDIEEIKFPHKLNVFIVSKEGETKIELQYKNIILNKEIKTPFKIPESYKRITIE